MKYLIFILTLLTFSFAKSVIVSIVPQKAIVKAVDENATVSVVVPVGSEPHTFEPKPTIMKKVANGDIYFAIGVEFEKSWLTKFQSQNPKLKVVHLDENITKINDNPHIWLSIKNLKIIAKKVANKLNAPLPVNYLKKLNECQQDIEGILKDKQNRTFMTFHPAFTYFAKDFNLTQLVIEEEGKEPSLKEIVKKIKKAKKSGINAIITSPEFSDKSAKVISKELGVKVIKLSPLNPDICQTLKEVAKSL